MTQATEYRAAREQQTHVFAFTFELRALCGPEIPKLESLLQTGSPLAPTSALRSHSSRSSLISRRMRLPFAFTILICNYQASSDPTNGSRPSFQRQRIPDLDQHRATSEIPVSISVAMAKKKQNKHTNAPARPPQIGLELHVVTRAPLQGPRAFCEANPNPLCLPFPNPLPAETHTVSDKRVGHHRSGTTGS
jgi:hypothetical protein